METLKNEHPEKKERQNEGFTYPNPKVEPEKKGFTYPAPRQDPQPTVAPQEPPKTTEKK
jgi:hypothetical protein